MSHSLTLFFTLSNINIGKHNREIVHSPRGHVGDSDAGDQRGCRPGGGGGGGRAGLGGSDGDGATAGDGHDGDML